MPKSSVFFHCNPARLAIFFALASYFCLTGGLFAATPQAFASPDADTGQSATEQSIPEQAPPAKPEPVEWKLSPEAEHFYYYLLFSEAMYQNNAELLAEATLGLLRLEPSLPIFQDGASIFLIRRDFEKAERIATEGLSHFPGDPTLTVFLSGVYSETGQVARAVSLLEKSLKSHPENPPGEVSQELIRLYLREGHNNKAQKLLAAYGKNSTPPAVTFFQAKLLIAKDELDKAYKVLRDLTSQYPEFPEAWIELGLLAEKRQNAEEAIAAYRRAARLVTDGQELLFRAIILQINNGKMAEALNTARQGAGTGQTSGGFFLQASLLFAEKGYIPEAELLLHDAVNNGANKDEAAMYLSSILYDSNGDPLVAATPLTTVGQDSEFYAKAAQRLAHLYLRAEKTEEAYATANRLRQHLPDNAEHWSLEGYTLVQLGKKDEALRLLREEAQRKPDNADLLFAQGSLYDTVGDRDKAMEVMENIVSQFPNHARALNYVGYSLVEKQKDLDRALALIQKALEEMPGTEYIIDSLAWAHFHRGEYEKAWEAIQQCLNLAAEDAIVWEHYAEIALAMGKKNEAIKGFTEALKLEPENADELAEKLKTIREGK